MCGGAVSNFFFCEGLDSKFFRFCGPLRSGGGVSDFFSVKDWIVNFSGFVDP